MTLRVGVIGYPVGHSLSPVFQQAAFNALGIDARYELWSTPPELMAERVESLRQSDALGANVTVPHKTRAFELVDEVSERARQAGAVNTIINRRGRLYGDNTDIPGFLAPLHERRLPLVEISTVVLGAGGATCGIVVALLSAGCGRIVIANRTEQRAVELARDFGHPVEPSSLGGRLGERLAEAGLLVNATSIGWEDEALPLDEALLDRLPSSALVYDLTYRETPLLRAAARRGLATLDGLPMLVHQGAESFRLWTGMEPPVALMLAAAQEARDARTQK